MTTMYTMKKILSTATLTALLLSGCQQPASNESVPDETAVDEPIYNETSAPNNDPINNAIEDEEVVANDNVSKIQLTYDILQSYNWELSDVDGSNNEVITALNRQTDNPLILNFIEADGQNILALDNTCNNYSAPYTIDNNKINIGSMAATQMLCPEPEANFDRAAANVVMGEYSLSQDATGMPMLTVVSSDNTASFKAVSQ